MVATLRALDVVNGQACHHHIEAGMGEGQFEHITVVHLDSISYPLGLGVHQGCRSTVLPLIYLRPKINAHGTTTRQAFSGANEPESTSAANVEHSFMPLH